MTLTLEVTNEHAQPVAGARVSLRTLGGDKPLGETDDAGLLEATVRPGPVQVSARGYEPGSFSPPAFGDATEVFWAVKLTSHADTALSGRVFAAGAPVAGAVVALLGPREGTPAVVLADDDGRFRFAEVPEGVNAIFALSAGHGEAKLPWASEREVAIELPGAAFVEGSVVDEKGRPVEGFTVRLRPRGEQAQSADVVALRRRLAEAQGKQRRTSSAWRWLGRATGSVDTVIKGADGDDAAAEDPDALPPGRFRAGPVRAGVVDVLAFAPGYQPAKVEGVELSAGATLPGLRLVLSTPAKVVGNITDLESGAPVSGATVSASGWSGERIPEFSQARTAGDGSYSLSVEADRRQRLQVRARGYLDLEVGGLEVGRGEELVKDLKLRRAPGQGKAREYVGIGATVRKSELGVEVLGLLEGGTAASALQKGDVIVRVDDTWVDELELRDAIDLLVGEAGSEVDVLVRRPGPGGDAQELELTLGRRRLTYPTN